jgi:hypothetical protein
MLNTDDESDIEDEYKDMSARRESVRGSHFDYCEVFDTV